MIMWKLWIYCSCILTAVVATVSTISINEKDIIDTLAGDTFVIRTWSYRGMPLYVTIAKDNKTQNVKTTRVYQTHMNVSIIGIHDNKVDDEKYRLMLNYDYTAKEVYLLLCNISRNDEGLYQIYESIYKTLDDDDPFEREEGEWNFQLNVFDPDEIKRGNVGENMTIMEFKRSRVFPPLLYHYEQIVAKLFYSYCDASYTTHFYGRLKCRGHVNKNRGMIEILNVTQRDAGLYKVVYVESSETERCFTDITDKPISAMIGKNVTFGWFYNQQGMIRTLRIIHPNEGVMMMLQPSNDPRIRSNFLHRLLYSGDISQNYMSFTLLNLSKSDTGVYTIETLHGNSIPGRKQLIVEESIKAPDVQILSTRKLGPSGEEEDPEIQRLKAEVVRIEEENRKLKTEKDREEWRRKLQETVKENEKLKATVTTSANGPNSALINKNTTAFHHSQSSTISSLLTVEPNAPDDQSHSLNVPVYVIPVVIGAVGVVIVMIACLIRIQRMGSNNLKPERRHALVECDTDLYLTPIAAERPLPVTPRENGPISNSIHQSNTDQNAQYDTSMPLIHSTQSICLDGYETIDISSDDDHTNTSNKEETIYESNETFNPPFQDTSGYLTALGEGDATLK